ncbi:MAG: hypothetical protein ACI4MN_05510 [Candidatus Coproplasma sp.]
MTKRLKLFLVILLGSVAIACCAAGCKIGQPSREEILADYKGGQVTYYANGGNFNKNKAIVVRDIYYKEADVPFFDLPDLNGEIFVSRGSYDFMGWYLPATYESGEHAGEIMYTYTYKDATNTEITVPAYPKLNSDGSAVINKADGRPVFCIDGSEDDILESSIQIVVDTTKPVDSERRIRADDHLIVCAYWKPSLRFEYRLVVDDGDDYVYDNNTYHNGDVIRSTPFGRTETNNPGQTTTVSFSGTTFVGNYIDAACTQLAKEDFNRSDYEGLDVEAITVYAKYIKGDWVVIKDNAEDVKDMFSKLYDNTKKYYIAEDITLSDKTVLSFSDNCKTTIEGNGHTIRNLYFKNSDPLASGSNVAPVFGLIYESTTINNLTLDGINIVATCKGSMTFHAICKEVRTGATLNNLTIKNINATISLPGSVINADEGNRTAWIFGSSYGTDEAFLQAFTGVHLDATNNELTIV